MCRGATEGDGAAVAETGGGGDEALEGAGCGEVGGLQAARRASSA